MWIRWNSLIFRIFVFCFLFVFITITFVSQSFYRYTENEIQSNNDFFVNQVLLKVDEYLNLSFSSLQSILFSVEANLQSHEVSDADLKLQLQKLYEVNTSLISNIYVIRPDTTIIGGSPLTPAFDGKSEQRKPFLAKAMENQMMIHNSKLYRSDQSGWTVTLF